MLKRTLQATMIVTLVTVISKITGFGREVAIAKIFGASSESDLIIMSQSIVLLIQSFFIVALNTTFIPVYNEHRSTDEKKMQFLKSSYILFGSISILVSCCTYLFADNIVSIIALRFSESMKTGTADVVRILSISIFFSSIISINNARLQADKKYLLPASTGVSNNIIVLAYLFVFSYNSTPIGIAISILIGVIIHLLLQTVIIKDRCLISSGKIRVNDSGAIQVLKLMIPVIIGTLIQQINALVDKAIGSGLVVGSISALNYANKLVLFFIHFITAALVTVYFTEMSEFAVKKDYYKFKTSLITTTNCVIMIVIPITFGLSTVGHSMVKLIFQRGVFNESATDMTNLALLCYSIGLIGYTLRDVYSRALYALKKTRDVMKNSILAVAINVFLSVTLAPVVGLRGIAFATSVSGIVSALLLMHNLKQYIGDYNLKNIRNTFIKTMISSLIMFAVIKFVDDINNQAGYGDIKSIIITSISGILIYYIAISIFKIKEISYVNRKMIEIIRKSAA